MKHRVVAVSRETLQIVAVGWQRLSLGEAHSLKFRLNFDEPDSGVVWELRHDKYLIGKEIDNGQRNHS